MKQEINGVLLLNKATNVSSNLALQQVKRLFNARKAGHTGTLDPMSTGLLPICFGEATKFSQYLIQGDKSYIANLKFGEATTTGDVEGEVLLTSDVEFEKDILLSVLENFIGISWQVPPMFSAIKHEGIPLYQYARKGINVPRKSRKIEIYSIELTKFQFPYATLKVHCSKGTYIRTLAEDIAHAVNSVAHLQGLHRIQSNHFEIQYSYSLEELAICSKEILVDLLLPTDTLVHQFDQFVLNITQQKQIKNGQLVHFSANYEIITTLSLYSEQGEFIGLGVYHPELKSIKALRLMSTS